jgi:hypothetical protein
MTPVMAARQAVERQASERRREAAASARQAVERQASEQRREAAARASKRPNSVEAAALQAMRIEAVAKARAAEALRAVEETAAEMEEEVTTERQVVIEANVSPKNAEPAASATPPAISEARKRRLTLPPAAFIPSTPPPADPLFSFPAVDDEAGDVLHRTSRTPPLSADDETGAVAGEPALHDATCGECDDDDGEVCAICLDAPAAEHSTVLGCSHRFCTVCITRLVIFALKPVSGPISNANAVAAMRACRCPACATALSQDEIDALLRENFAGGSPMLTRLSFALRRARAAADAADADAAEAADAGPAALPPADPQAERTYQEWARRLHIKHCPQCAAPIEKNGGCVNSTPQRREPGGAALQLNAARSHLSPVAVRCGSCGLQFRWDRVPLACPCKGYHTTPKFPFYEKCKHVRQQDVTTRHKLEFQLKRGVVLAPLVAAAAPFAAVGVSCFLAVSHAPRAPTLHAAAGGCSLR